MIPEPIAKALLNRTLESISRSMPVDYIATYSRRIEGQIESRIVEGTIRSIDVYVEESALKNDVEIIKDIIRQIYENSSRLNRERTIECAIFFFHDAEGKIRIASCNAASRGAFNEERFQKSCDEFVPCNQTLSLEIKRPLNDHALLVFITSVRGADLDAAWQKRQRRACHQAIWVRIDGEHIEFSHGLPSVAVIDSFAGNPQGGP